MGLDTDLQVMTIGGAGGTKITTASAFVALNIMAFEKAVNFAVAEPRLHHQLDPMVLQYQDGFDLGIIGELSTEKGHVTQAYSYGSSSAPTIFYNGGVIQAKGDSRREDCEPAGV